MRPTVLPPAGLLLAGALLAGALLAAAPSPGRAQSPVAPPAASTADSAADPIQGLVGRLSLERYKGTIKELTRFGDRRQGTARNRAALDWIEAQLRSYGCANTERSRTPTRRRRRARRARRRRATRAWRRGAGGRAASARPRG
jgi:hypothetical protein